MQKKKKSKKILNFYQKLKKGKKLNFKDRKPY